jgi:hypothetical protein
MLNRECGPDTGFWEEQNDNHIAAGNRHYSLLQMMLDDYLLTPTPHHLQQIRFQILAQP